MQTKIVEIKKDIFWVGVVDASLRVFDITMETKYGTTYNAYIVKGSEKTVLIDTAKANFNDDYLTKVQQLVAIETVDYLVLNHTEPDHSGSIEKILELNPNIVIIASSPALSNIKEIVNRPFQSMRATDGMEISLGDRTLQFMIMPNLHWPDTMFTYLKEDKMLFTCDFFGAHYAFDGVFVKNVENQNDYYEALRYYFDCIMSPFKPFVIKALDRMQTIDIEYVLTSHGAIIDPSNLEEVKVMYRAWASPNDKNILPVIVMPYASAYGYTLKMSTLIEEGLRKAFQGEVIIKRFDLVETKTEEVISAIEEADAFLIGSTTILNDSVKPVWDVLTSLNPVIHGGKFASAFGSYGWSGEAVKFIMERLTQLKMKTIDGLRIRFNPSAEQSQQAIDFGYQFGLFMQGK